MRFAVAMAGRLLIGLIVALMTAWCAGALYAMRVPAARAWAASSRLTSWWPPRWPSCSCRGRGRTLIGFLIAFIVVITWWIFIPAIERSATWQAEVAESPRG